MERNPPTDDLRSMSEFVDLLARNQLRLFHYVCPLVPTIQDAEDVMQEVSKTLWEEFAKFEPGTNFLAWARQIAHYRVLEFRKKANRRPQLFPDDVLDALAADAAAYGEELDARSEALALCSQKLVEKDRRLIQQRYSGVAIEQLALAVGRPINSVYQSLWRIRRNLLDCIERQIARTHSDRGAMG